MKTGKKILALVLVALMLTVAMNFTAFAATIDVDGAYENETYNAYKILEYTSNTTIDPPAFSYYLNHRSSRILLLSDRRSLSGCARHRSQGCRLQIHTVC